jgi:Asp/Glu/hydantoin racemase
MMKLKGGYLFYGKPIGIILGSMRFPRPVGDIGHAETFPFPVRYISVEGAMFQRLVTEGDPALIEPYIEAARTLEAEGVRAITTSCGFLALFQRELAAAVKIPVFTSSLMLLPLVDTMLGPDQRVGVVTVDSSALTPDHFAGVGAANVPRAVVGTESGREFTRYQRENDMLMDFELARQDMINAALRLQEENQDVGAIVLECTNMPPYAADIQRATGLPVFDIVSLIHFAYLGLVPPIYQQKSG